MTSRIPALAVCVAVYKTHGPPNVMSMVEELPAALGGLDAELVVVLNGVQAEQVELPAGAHVVRFELNEGVPIAWNAAARVATAPVICVANDDVSLGAGSLRVLHDTLLSAPDAGAAGPVGTLWDVPQARHRAYLDLDDRRPGEAVECDVLSGFLFLTPRMVFERVGGFDEAFTPCGFEEVDYCTAVRHRLGLRCYAVAGVPIAHKFGISAKRPWRKVAYQGRAERLGHIARRNRAHFLSKWGP